MFMNKLRQIGLFTVLATALFQLPCSFTIAQEQATGAAGGANGAAPQAGPNAAVPGASPASAPAAAGGDDAAVAKGLAIFTANCKQCHAINDQVVGPALRDAHKRWPSDAALAAFIKYPQKTIDGGDAYAKSLYDKYKQYMPNHDFLSDDDIKSVITWIKKESAAPAVATATATADVNSKDQGGDKAVAGGADGTTMNIVLVVLLIVLVIVLLILVMLVSVLSKAINGNNEVPADEKEFVTTKTNWGGFFKSPAFRTVVILVFSFVLLKAGYDKVYAIGINQGYAPKQPIAFSHKLHAGMYEIQCQYCHTGVERGKSATIPSVNICMNCHNAIKTESPEIKKLWTAVEKNRPIEWVRVHNLPDLAYFNHAQHVKVGGLECQACHGAIQEMEVVQQHSTLTMGWCINCHRQTAVKAKDNAYYDKLLYLHKQTKKGEMRVADIGGLECSKCHY